MYYIEFHININYILRFTSLKIYLFLKNAQQNHDSVLKKSTCHYLLEESDDKIVRNLSDFSSFS